MEVSSIESNTRFDNYNQYNEDESEPGEKRWYHHVKDHLLPTKDEMNILLTQVLILLFFCITLYGMLGKNALPGSEIFALLILGFFAMLGGMLVDKIMLPPLLGMMIVGFIYRNVDAVSLYDDIGTKTVIALREAALSVILMRAGLGIDGKKLMTMKFVVVRLTVIPLLVEATSMGVLAHFLLDLPWIFSFMLGFIMSAIAPEVVLPIILYLEGQGYGVKKGIPTLLIAATSLDDVIAITGFTICFSVAFTTANLTWTIVKAPLEPLVGLAYGLVFGTLLWSLPSKNINKNVVVYYNVLTLTLGCMVALFSSSRLGIPSAGPLGCITLAFVAAWKYREDEEQFNGIQAVTSKMWYIIEPFLFSLIGSEVTIRTLKANAAYGSLSIILGLCFRSLATIMACYRAGLNFKEKLYMVCAWIPKAVVQAAIGSQALDYARLNKLDEDLIEYGTTVLNISVLSILITAPLSAALCTLLGPYLLTKEEIPEDQGDDSKQTKPSEESLFRTPSESETPKA